jgi:hypothetical protein
MPGGDAIGSRPIDIHLRGLERMGAKFTTQHGYIEGVCDRLHGVYTLLEFPSVGATENILMAAVHAGGDRQELHERIRRHSQEAARRVKQDGYSNDLLDRLQSDDAFSGVDINAAANPKEFIGRAPQQVDEFLAEVVEPIRERYPTSVTRPSADVKV